MLSLCGSRSLNADIPLPPSWDEAAPPTLCATLPGKGRWPCLGTGGQVGSLSEGQLKEATSLQAGAPSHLSPTRSKGEVLASAC